MGQEGVLYIDKKGREVLYVPKHFIVINYMKREPEIIFDLRRLKIWDRNWNTGRANLREFLGNPEIEQSDVDEIFDAYFNRSVDEAKRDCVDLFDYIINKEYGINSETRSTFRRELRWE